MTLNRLGTLADPNSFQDPLDLRNTPDEVAFEMLYRMALIRRAEEQIAEMVLAGEIKCPCHFAIGQEAPAVGISMHLRATDRGFGAHRSHSHYLASGGSVDKLFAEVLGRATGASHGMGGSMHLFGEGTAFAGSVPIVAGTVPLAVGAALAAKLDGSGDVGIAYFGDGACEEGIVHESLNLAATMKLPVIFLVENNLYSSHLDINLRQPSDRVARFGEAHGMATEVVDGNDVVKMASVAGRLIERARAGEGPGFIEAVTYRWLGHVGPDANIDVGLRRSAEEVSAWKKRDPIARLEAALLARGVEQGDINALKDNAERAAKDARKKAYDAPWPKETDLLDFVYASGGAK
ncbi:thiamine pyrophosphate-dependent dehydrogenase E1 component subunit alpha [Marivivens sp. LCG002]|uniref:thiamine pyrophosphate-dependent dehydrogenase E1 component subunit alpha n=1 Tax=Marivivens sp. LCG002 TaxID=3051171 RepID=UPI002552BA1B|nr:thiamine pyrophosphate-dependent dehydrogenase E1 component subunit alpha [Marivivens sp. LCG002]WIV51415.1 thiamine pyrophosphate-dependent dehydrogenase E1 component subunit alpha [Marivivens sp. LCG002]